MGTAGRKEEFVDGPYMASEHPLSILVVGDFDDAAINAFEAMGFGVHTAADGIEALAALTAGLRPRLMILDMRVPERMDRVVLAALKTKELAEIPVVILSEFEEIKEDPVAKVFILRSLDLSAIYRITQIVPPPSMQGEKVRAVDKGALDELDFEALDAATPGSPTIMVVEDDADHRAALAELLEEAGYDVATAAHGRQALSELSTRPLPDLVLLDLMMPELDGWGFMAEFQRNPVLSSIPVVVVSTGSKAMFDAAPAATRYLRKPLDSRKLLRTIEECLGEPRQQRISTNPDPLL
jgi:CheY-like chemotaxis protein